MTLHAIKHRLWNFALWCCRARTVTRRKWSKERSAYERSTFNRREEGDQHFHFRLLARDGERCFKAGWALGGKQRAGVRLVGLRTGL
jgi:hypothetical protein